LIDITIVFVSYNTAELTKKAIQTVLASNLTVSYEILVVDNASKDNSVQILKSCFPAIKLIENKKNVGFGRAHNQLLSLIKSKYVLLINTDAFVEPDTIQKTFEFMETNSNCGILGVKLIGRDGVLQPSCRYFPTIINLFLSRIGLSNQFKKTVQNIDDMEWDHASVRSCDWVPGCYYLVRKELIDQVGLFDDRFFLYYEEVDHCLAAKNAGWDVLYYPFTEVVHIGGESAKSASKISSVSRQISVLQVESELVYFRKNKGLLYVITHIFLTLVAEVYLTLKSLLKLLLGKKVVFNVANISTWIKIAIQTRMGKKPIH
jgi:N-acetylglucosaminyl-diphospho-decaprenol L-rhamnosyltransferase